jgi:anti-sigma B factor antagonist
MSVEVEYTGTSARVMLGGELSIYSVAEVKSALAEAMVRASELEVDLSGVTEIDSAGLQLMLIVKRHPESAVRFVGHPPEVLRLVDLAQLGEALGDPLFIAASAA